MKMRQLSSIKDEAELNRLISDRFIQWDEIHENGQDGFMSDGFCLNYIRGEIVQLRDRRNKLFGAPVVGQLSLFGGETEAERPIPEVLPQNWSVNNGANLEAHIRDRMASVLQNV